MQKKMHSFNFDLKPCESTQKGLPSLPSMQHINSNKLKQSNPKLSSTNSKPRLTSILEIKSLQNI